MSTPSSALPPKVIVVTLWYGGNEGGVAVVTESLVHSLMDAGVPCAILQMLPGGWWPQTTRGTHGEEIVGICVRDLSTRRRIVSKVGGAIRDALATRAFRALMPTDGRGCVVHFHYSMPEFEHIVNLCTRWGIPMVSTFHGSDIGVNMRDPRTRQATHKQVLRSHFTTAVSDALRQATVDLFPEVASRAVVVHNAVPPGFIDAAAAAPLPPGRDLDVLFVGNLNRLKGVDVLIHAWVYVLDNMPQARLTIAGHGPLAAELEDLAGSLGVSHAVAFVGRQTRAELPTLYRRAKILAVPSRSEALGVVILEAQLCGAAVVASAVGGIPEVVRNGETGVLVQPDDPELLGQALLALMRNADDRDKLATAGMNQVSENFTPKFISSQYRTLYERAASSPLPVTPI